jgi:hypothetical protein
VRARQDLLPSERAELLEAPTLTLAEVARVLGVGLSALRGALRRGDISFPVISIGTRKVVPVTAVRHFLGMDAAQPIHPSDGDPSEPRAQP